MRLQLRTCMVHLTVSTAYCIYPPSKVRATWPEFLQVSTTSALPLQGAAAAREARRATTAVNLMNIAIICLMWAGRRTKWRRCEALSVIL